MFELFRAGGPLMWAILLCSVLALTIIFERLFSLRKTVIAPANLSDQVFDLVRGNAVTHDKVDVIKDHSVLGQLYASGLNNLPYGLDAIKEGMEETGKQIVHKLSRYLNTLGTIASITPLIGLLGTVIGMIKVFTAITAVGVGDPTVLSGGISEALITTAAGLSVGIPCLMFYRYFRSRIQELTVLLEEHALEFVDVVKASAARPKRTVTRKKVVAKKTKKSTAS